MKNKKVLVVGFAVLLTVNVVGQSNSTSNTSTVNSSFQIENPTIDSSVSVNQFGKNIANISSKYYENGTGSKTFDVSLSGNVSQVLDVPSSFTLFNNESASFPVVANVPLSQEFGMYNGSLNMSSDGFSDSVDVSVTVVDDVKPSIVEAEIGSVQATESKQWVLQVDDNLKVESVNGSVVRKVEEMRGNESVLVNETVVESFDFVNESDGSWTYNFDKTSDINDNYFLKINAFDESGNKKQETFGFAVEGLNSIDVLETDFKFKDSRPRTDDDPNRVVEKKVFDKRLDRELGLSLSDFSNLSSKNKSLTLGIRNEDSENIRELYEDGEYTDVVVEKSGSYYLVVFSEDSGFSYDGTLKLDPVPQHVDIDESIEFNGAFVDPEYPELPDERSLGSFNGSMEFILNENGVPTGIRYSGEQLDIEECKNAESWSNCIPGFSLGEVPDVKEENNRLEARNGSLTWQRNAAVFSALLFIFITLANGYGKGTMETEKKIRESNIGQIVQNREEVQLGKV